jgi:hypothetical protein
MAQWTDRQLGERAGAAEQSRAAILPYVRACLEATMPWRLDGRQGSLAFERMADSTGALAVHKSASRLQRDFTPSFQRWFELEAGPLVPPQIVEQINRGLESATQVCHAALDNSAFSQSSLEAYADLLVSTGALLAREGDDQMPIIWRSAPAWALAFEEGPSGRVENTFFVKDYPAHMLPRLWPKAEWSEKTRGLIAAQSTVVVKVRQSTYYDAELGRWRLAIQELGATQEPVVYDSSRDRTNPWIIFRYWTTPGDPWGRGPVMLALPDIRTANKTVEFILRSAAYALAPPMMVLHDGVVNPDNVNFAPHALIKVARTGGPMGRSIEPLQLGQGFDVGQLILTDMRDNINRNLNAQSLPPESGAVRSATEWMERTKANQYEAGAAFGRLNHEFVPQVVARVIDLLDRRNVYGINWDELKIDQFIMRVKVTSPLARSQNLEDAELIVQFWTLAMQIGGKAAFMQVANLEDGLPRLAKLMGVPLWSVNDPETRAKLAEAAGQMVENMVAANDGAGVEKLITAA